MDVRRLNRYQADTHTERRLLARLTLGAVTTLCDQW
jgi:hypothetical protein